MLGRTDHRLRMLVLLAALVALALATLTRLSYWQVARGPELQAKAMSRLERSSEVQAIRGNIVDRNGVVLATTGYRDTLAAYPNVITDPDRRADIIEAVSTMLDLDRSDREALSTKLDQESQYVVLARELTETQSAAVRAWIGAEQLTSVVLEPHPVRIYPAPGGAPGTTLASQLIGFVSVDGTGHYGIEQEYDAQLAGRPKLVAAARDVRGRPLESSARVLDPGADGLEVRLTIDASLQLQLERELYAAWTADKAKRASGLIMDPRTGEILAWASVPGYDGNQYGQVAATNPSLLLDPIASDMYEPGSVMKMLTATAALGNRTVTPSTSVRDVRALRFGSQVIHNADWLARGWMPFRDVIAYSRNLATARVARKLGETVGKSARVLYRAWHTLGIVRKTGIDIANEAAGIAANPQRQQWQPIDLANRAFGQSVAVTLIQLATAYTPMVNGGLRVKPHFLMAVADQPTQAATPRRVMRRALATQLRGILKHVTSAVPWYAEGSLIKGYEVGGKTGTAQIWRARQGRYDYRTFNFSFIGYVGGDRPEAVVAVRIHEAKPKVLARGQLKLGITSYQLFRRVALGIIARLDIPPSQNPKAGLPEPLSEAEKIMAPTRYEKHRDAARQARTRTHHGR